jgi:adenosylcobinamide kinase/adenosylcobinamide-phosphate guanylyltransferase
MPVPVSPNLLIFVTGGARSGKSRYAQACAEGFAGSLLYVATAEIRDEEMRRRVDLHRADRGNRWATLEEPLDLAGAVGRVAGHGAALVDCLTLWTSNLLEAHGEDDDAIERRVLDLENALTGRQGNLVVVTNEVGLGIVPDNALARRFRDVAGRINQRVAALADESYFVVSGRPLRLG